MLKLKIKNTVKIDEEENLQKIDYLESGRSEVENRSGENKSKTYLCCNNTEESNRKSKTQNPRKIRKVGMLRKTMRNSVCWTTEVRSSAPVGVAQHINFKGMNKCHVKSSVACGADLCGASTSREIARSINWHCDNSVYAYAICSGVSVSMALFQHSVVCLPCGSFQFLCTYERHSVMTAMQSGMSNMQFVISMTEVTMVVLGNRTVNRMLSTSGSVRNCVSNIRLQSHWFSIKCMFGTFIDEKLSEAP